MTTSSTKKGILERLAEGPMICDGGFVFALEKRGYVTAGPWTPEAVVEHPDAVKQLHREFCRSGSDVIQAFTFYASEDKLENRGNKAAAKYGCDNINERAVKIAQEVADEYGALVLGGVCQTPAYLSGEGEEGVKAQIRKQAVVFKESNCDFLLAEYFEHIEECVWAIEVLKETGLPVAASMCIGPEGDVHGTSAAECAVAMARAGAQIVGVNCHFDPFVSLDALQLMKDGLNSNGFDTASGAPHLMCQPLAYMTPDAGVQGFIDLPEFPFGLEPRICTRAEMRKFARRAWEMDCRFIGGCCGFEPYHIRACAEELVEERGHIPGGPVPIASRKQESIMLGSQLLMHTKPWVRARASKEYWEKLNPASGRPLCACMSKPDAWKVTAGDKELVQQKRKTTSEEAMSTRAKFVKT